MKYVIKYLCVAFCFIVIACQPHRVSDKSSSAWKETLSDKIMMLGHRNWILITDMAYPLQTKSGIKTIYVDDSYEEVLSFLIEMLDNVPHVYGHIYQDKELNYLNEKICPGINNFRKLQFDFFQKDDINYVNHEILLNKIDSVSSYYEILVVKTNLTLPYTSTFIELDCRYWNIDKQRELEVLMDNVLENRK